MSLDLRFEFAEEIALEAGTLLMKHLGMQNEPHWTAETKETNFKIVMDMKSDALIRERIKKFFPEDDIYSEEDVELNRGRRGKWVVDPLDGTIPYTIHASNNWSVAIAYVEGNEPLLGVVNLPERNEIYKGMLGKGAYCNGIRIRVSPHHEMKKLHMSIGGGKAIDGWFNKESMKLLRDMLDKFATFLNSGCASAPLCQVASGLPDRLLPRIGRLEGYIGGALEPFDVAAEVPILREAGAKVTHFSGKEWKFSPIYKGDPTVIAANPVLHGKLMDYLEKEFNEFYAANGFGKYR